MKALTGTLLALPTAGCNTVAGAGNDAKAAVPASERAAGRVTGN